jgi:hydroxypyruvate reductase
MVSDVPNDDPCVLGSGLLHAGPLAAAIDEVPPAIHELLGRARSVTTEAMVPRIPARFVATLRHAVDAAARAAEAQGYRSVRASRRLSGEAAVLGPRLVARLRRLPPATVQVWGGESTVTLPAAPGRGGRNQHLALAAALSLDGGPARPGIALLAAGTDGIDGTSDDAGAIVDAGTCTRGRDAGFDPHVSLASADSGSFLEASGDLLHTGPTLTNVGDLVLGLVPDRQGVR